MTRTPPKLALPWILEEDWPQWQDVDHGVPTYEKWVELFNRNLKLAESYNWPYQRVPVRPEAFNEWCKANQRTIGKFDRSLYALELLRTGGSAQLELPSSEDTKHPRQMREIQQFRLAPSFPLTSPQLLRTQPDRTDLRSTSFAGEFPRRPGKFHSRLLIAPPAQLHGIGQPFCHENHFEILWQNRTFSAEPQPRPNLADVFDDAVVSPPRTRKDDLAVLQRATSDATSRIAALKIHAGNPLRIAESKT